MTMRVQSVVRWIVIIGTLTGGFSGAAAGQQLTLSAGTPRFLYASSAAAKPVEIDVSRSAVLNRVVSLHVEHGTIGGVLADIHRQAGILFAYDPRFPATRIVTLEAEAITVAAALGAILVGTGVDIVLTPTGHVWLEPSPRESPVQKSTIVGRVTDKERGDPIVGATVVLEPARQSASTGPDGRYRFADLTPGNYTVRARYIGYVSLAAAVAVGADQEATVDFPLQKSAQQLEQIVTTGTVVPTEIKALPTPVSLITESDIAIQRPRTVPELFRQVVPGAVGWGFPAIGYNTYFSVRGATTFSTSGGQMKVFVDGVEVAGASRTPVDPNSIERIEVVRGPQAAAIYGSDAIGGVIQIFTKRGDPTLGRPTVDGQAALGVVQTPYAGYGGVLRQSYSGAVRGGGADVSYNLGGSYSRTEDYLPNGDRSRQSSPSVYGGMRYARGIMTLDLSGRYYTTNSPSVFNPVLTQIGGAFFSKPDYLPVQVKNQTFGARASLTPTQWLTQSLTLGVDRQDGINVQSQPRFTSPEDTLLSIFSSNQTKTFIGFNSSVHGTLSSNVTGSLTAGIDHYNLPVNQFFSDGTLNTSGTIQPAPDFPLSASHSVTNNTGYFAQAQFGLQDALFVTGGVRAEENSDFGDSLGTPVSPRVGVSYVRNVGAATVKVRGSWGRAIRAPSPGRKFASVTPHSVTLASPQLGPERQRGWDAGVDVALGRKGSLSVTYYDQTAEDLIQYVQLSGTSIPTFQFQNVGRVKNTGIEVEGTASAGPIQLKANYAYTRARIEQLAANYTGDLRVGDQALATPKHTAGASLVVTPRPTTSIAAGLTYVGTFSQYDLLAEYVCFTGGGPCAPSNRDYIISYPGFVKVNATVSQQITQLVTAFATVDNLTNNEAYEFWNYHPVLGRTTTAGLQFHY
jgi:outer membrane receptor protein involved in Fe transport